MPPHRVCRDQDGSNDLPRLQNRLNVRRIAWKAVEFYKRNSSLSRGAPHVHRGVQGHECHCKIGGMGGNACLASAEQSVPACLTTNRRAAGARLALVARGIANI